MKKLKKFNELFDTDDLKSRSEIDYLSGNLSHLGKKLDHNFKDEGMIDLLHKISNYHYPFFELFEELYLNGGSIKFDEFEAYISHGEETNDHCVLVAKSPEFIVALGLKINSVNNYDAFIYFDDVEFPDDEDKNPGSDFEGLSFTELMAEIKEVYINFIKDAGFDELLEISKDKIKEINN